jgi:DNA-binding HxlR family transcriptional regulator
MKWDDVSESACHIARALSVVGDRWTLLIMREIGIGGVRRFEEIQAQTGMSSQLLAARLKRMEEHQVIERRPYQSNPDRYEYHATLEGKELDAVLLALRGWGMRREGVAAAEPSIALADKISGNPIDANWPFPTGKPFTFAQVDVTLSEAFAVERASRQTAFQTKRQAHKARRKK